MMASVAPVLATIDNQCIPLSTSTTTVGGSVSSDYTNGGIKRKHSEVEVEDKWSERQSILNLSMSKLQPSPGKGEASLRRSVLIFNTLRYLERDLQNSSAMPLSNLPIPPKDVCLDPCHTDEVLGQINNNAVACSSIQQQKSVKKQEEHVTYEPSVSYSSSYLSSSESSSSSSSLLMPINSSTPSSSPPLTTSQVYSMDYSYTTAPVSQPCQNSEQFLQDTTYILDSLLSAERVNGFGPILPQTQVEPSWEEPDNMWLSKYDEPFTNWLLNDDLDHIMQIIVGGSAG